jgi:hypothetical protein
MPVIEQAFDLITQFTSLITALKNEVVTLRGQLEQAQASNNELVAKNISLQSELDNFCKSIGSQNND